MKKVLSLISMSLVIAVLFVLVTGIAKAETTQTDFHNGGYHDGYHGGRDGYHGGYRGGGNWSYRGFHGEHYDYHYRGRGWFWGFPAPLWFVPGVSECREYFVQRQVGIDAYGNPVFVTDQHIECTDQFGFWLFVR